MLEPRRAELARVSQLTRKSQVIMNVHSCVCISQSGKDSAIVGDREILPPVSSIIRLRIYIRSFTDSCLILISAITIKSSISSDKPWYIEEVLTGSPPRLGLVSDGSCRLTESKTLNMSGLCRWFNMTPRKTDRHPYIRNPQLRCQPASMGSSCCPGWHHPWHHYWGPSLPE